jgi:hypothetical protein
MADRRVSLGKVIRAFKAKCTKVIHDTGRKDFQWQRYFYERIIRDGQDYDRIRQYILDNPMNWGSDDNHPRNVHTDLMHDEAPNWSALD